MTLDDLKRIFLGPTLFRLDTIIGPKLVPLLYAAGLVGTLLWAITHLFATFGRTFGDGLWGLLEIVVFGVLGIVVLRIVCEALLVFFKANEVTTRTVSLTRMPGSLLEEVREAIHDIAEEHDPYADPAGADPAPPETSDVPASRPARRTARRSPPPDL
jgi:hypothetical protein